MAAIASASLGWAIWVYTFGGFDTSVLGLRIRSNNPRRILVVSAIALGLYLLSGGRVPLRRLAVHLRAVTLAVSRRPAWIVAAIAAASAVAGMAGSTRIAGGADAYGYLSQAELWLQGDLVVQQPWVKAVPWPEATWSFTPLGYRPSRFGDGSIVPTYSPGLPMLLAIAKRVGGHCAMFAVVPLLSGLAVLATYGIGVRLGSQRAGVVAAWLLATSPVILGSLEPLTDVPVMAAWTVAVYFLLGTSIRSALLCGLCAGLAILIRPNLVPLAAPMGAWFLVRRTSDSSVVRSRLLPAACFASGVMLGAGAVAFLNDYLYGSPTTSGYGRLEDQFALHRIVPNLRRYLSWLVETQTVLALVGLAALFIPSRRLWPKVQDRRILVVIAAYVATLWTMFVAYLEFDSWGYLRFLLPSWPLIMLGAAAAISAVARLRVPGIRYLAFVTVVAVGLWTVHLALRLDVYDQRQAARHEAPIGRLLRRHTPSNSVVLAFERSGSMRYYAGRITLRYDSLDPLWLDKAVAWLGARGVAVYAVLDKRQAAEAKERFKTQNAASAFDHPFLTYEPAGTSLFNLSGPSDGSTPPTVITEAFADVPGCDPPVRLAPLVVQ